MSKQEVFDQLKYRIEVGKDGRCRYYNIAGQLHRTDGPAVEWVNGEHRWYQSGLLHRDDGPAVEWADGSKSWWQNGQRHRTDGPAVELTCGYTEYRINGEPLTEAEFNRAVKQNV